MQSKRLLLPVFIFKQKSTRVLSQMTDIALQMLPVSYTCHIFQQTCCHVVQPVQFSVVLIVYAVTRFLKCYQCHVRWSWFSSFKCNIHFWSFAFLFQGPHACVTNRNFLSEAGQGNRNELNRNSIKQSHSYSYCSGPSRIYQKIKQK